MGYFKKWPFRLVPERNPEVWADRSALLSEIQSFFEVRKKPFPSKILVIWGAFGAGKSHLLKNFKWRLEQERTGFVIFSPFPKRTINGFHELYQEAFAERMDFFLLGKAFAKIWKSRGGRDELEYLFDIASQVDNWYDFAQVVLTLGKLFSGTPRLNDPHFLLARSWLSGYKLTKQERIILGVNDDVRTDDGAIRLFSSMTRILTSLGDISFVIWMLDDCHVLLSKTLERKKDLILFSLKTAFDECPDNLILALSFATKDPEAIEDFLIPDLLRRINRIGIAALNEKEAFVFIMDLIKIYRNIDTPACYPFAEENCVYAIVSEVSKSDLSPGNLMSNLDRLMQEAEKTIFPNLITPDFIDDFYKKHKL